jgi:hypothetical protein
VPGMVSLWRGWLPKADGDGWDPQHWSDITAWTWVDVEQSSVPPSRAPPSSFEGAAHQPYESGWHTVAEVTLALPQSVV